MYLPLLGLQTRKSISIMLTSAIRHRLSLPCAKLRSQRKVLQHLLPNHYVHDSCAFRQGFGYNAFGYTTSSSSGGSHSNQAPGGGWQEGGGEGDGGWKQNGGAGSTNSSRGANQSRGTNSSPPQNNVATSSSGMIMRGVGLDIRCNPDVSWVLERADRYWGRRLTPKSLKFYQSPCLWYAGHAFVLSSEGFKIHDKYKHAAKSCTEGAVPGMLKWLEDEAGHTTRDGLSYQTMGRKVLGGKASDTFMSKSWLMHPGFEDMPKEMRDYMTYRTSRPTLFNKMPITWLAAVVLSVAEVTLATSAVGRENFPQLLQRCDFRIANATAEDPGDLSSLYELLEWVHYSLDTNSVTALPRLLDAGVLKVALRGASSSSPQVSAVCHDLLMSLSFNFPTAALMARDPEIRQELVKEARRRTQLAMDAAAHRHELMTDTARSIAELSEADKARGAQHTVEKETGPSLSTETRGLGSRSISVRGGRRHSPVKLPPENSAAQNDMDNGGDRTDMMSDSQGRSAESGNVDVHDDGAEGAHNSTEEMLFMSGDELKGTMLNACNALRALRNVLGASRLSLSEAGSSATDGSGGRRRSAPPTADKMPWPISMLYGSQLYVSDGERGDTHAGEPVMEWPVDLSLVDSVAQLLVATSAFNAIQTAVPSLHHAPSSLHSDPDKQGKTGVRVVEMPIEAATLFWAVGPVFQEVRMETSGLLHEISSDTHMVELLMRRNYLDTLLTVGVPGQQGPAQVSYRNTVDAFINANIFRQRQDTVERRACSTVSNIVDGFKRRHPVTEMKNMVTKNWNEIAPGKLLDDLDDPTFEGGSETTPEPLGEQDRLYVDQVVEMNRLLTQPHIFMGDRQELRNSAFETAIVGFIWGYLRRRVAWIRSGEKFAVAKNGRVLQAAVVSSNGALRAACGSLALSLLAGYRFYLRDQTLDREKGRHGTVVMSCARAALDLGVLYAVLRACPYSLLPVIAVNSLVGGLEIEMGNVE